MMADPFSTAAGVVGTTSLGIQVVEKLVKFYSLYKDQDADISRTTERLESLLVVFRSLDSVLRSRQFQTEEQGLIKTIDHSIQKCDEIIKELQDECAKLGNSPASGVRGAIKQTGHRVAYPFRQSTLQKFDEDIGEIRENLSIALNTLQLRDHKETRDDLSELKALVDLVKASQTTSAIYEWLNAPDATINHHAASAKRHPGTGLWLIEGPQFTTWLSCRGSFLWLNGFAGCGKSVLCSTAIQHTFHQMRHEAGVGIAFFYFTFTDRSKEDESAMLRAVLLQLSRQLQDNHADLTRLRSSNQSCTPSTGALTECLKAILQKFQQVYIFLDALDESPRYRQREGVLRVLERIRSWNLPQLHLLATSRDEPDIRESLDVTADQDVHMRNIEIDEDIISFISSQLSSDTKLRKWQKYHHEIQEALVQRAQGIFRYVECQFDALARCPSKSHLDKCLKTLPRGLHETYERMLRNIDEDYVEDARRILTLLCFSARPLSVDELTDACAVDLDEPPHYDPDRRMDLDGLRGLCPGLIDVVPGQAKEHNNSSSSQIRLVVRIAHFSVQEYLESDCIHQQKAAIFGLESTTAHSTVGQICLVYLLEPRLASRKLENANLELFPFARFAATFWHTHYTNARDAALQMESLVLKLFTQKDSFRACISLYDVRHLERHDFDHLTGRQERASNSLDDMASQVYYSCILGLEQVLRTLLATVSSNSSEIKRLVNARVIYGSPLLEAASYGHENVVKILLNAGADVNAQSRSRSPLQMASRCGHENVVRILLDAGADVNFQKGWHDSSALHEASRYGLDNVVRMLLDAGADVNARGGCRRVLHAASVRGHENVVRMLLDAGAEEMSANHLFHRH